MLRVWRWLNRRNSVRWDAICSVTDQALLSGGSVLVTAVSAYLLSPAEFGRFTIAWSLAALFEAAILKPLFDDSLPSMAARLSTAAKSELRSSQLIWSVIAAGTIGCLALLVGMIVSMIGGQSASLYVTGGVLILASRMHNAMRRICYLDRRLRIVVGAEVLYFITLLSSMGFLIQTHRLGAAAAMSCSALASSAAFSFVLVRRKHLKRPSRRMLMWSVQNMMGTGRWIVLAGLAYWAGSSGVVPITGLVLGSAASGSVRILFLLFAPLGQLNAALLSMWVPRSALQLRSQGAGATENAAAAGARLFGGIAAIYGFCVVVGGILLMRYGVLFGAYNLSVPKIVLMALAMTFEGTWSGLALPLFATAQTRRFLASRLVALAFLLGPFPLAGWMWGISGIAAAIALSSATSVLMLALELRVGRAGRHGVEIQARPSKRQGVKSDVLQIE